MPAPDLPEPLRTVRDVLVFYAESELASYRDLTTGETPEDYADDCYAIKALSALDAAQVEVWWQPLFAIGESAHPYREQKAARRASITDEAVEVLVIFPAEEPDDG